MKKLFLITILINANFLFGQSEINYISVNPKYCGAVEDESSFNSYCYYEFFLNITEAYNNKYCYINFAVDRTGEYAVIASTGWDAEYTEDKQFYTITSMDSAYCNLKISTQNLPKLHIFIAYEGRKRNMKINDVTISFSGKKH